MEEQPYAVPDNWRWVKMGSICQFERGITFPKKAKEKEPSEENIPCLRTTNVQEELFTDDLIYVDKKYMKNNPAKLVRANDIIMSSANSRELVGKICYINELSFPMTFGGFVLNIRAKDIISEYLFYFLRHEFLFDNFKKLAAQTVNIANINTTKLSNYFIPVPPTEEQNKIVKNIRSLFEKLDKAKKLLQNIVDNYELRRAAILYKILDYYDGKKVILSDVCKINPQKISTKNMSDDIEVSFISMSSLSAELGTIIESQTRSLNEVKKGFTNFSEGDVIFAKITPCMENGKSAIVGKLINDIGYGSTEFYVLRCNDELYNRFIYHLIRSQKFRDEAKKVMTGSVGQLRVPRKFLENYNLKLPKIEEQKEIVCILDSLLSKEQRIKELAEKILQEIEMLKKSILARAFRGKL